MAAGVYIRAKAHFAAACAAHIPPIDPKSPEGERLFVRYYRRHVEPKNLHGRADVEPPPIDLRALKAGPD